VDGPSIVQKAGTWKTSAVANHPIHASYEHAKYQPAKRKHANHKRANHKHDVTLETTEIQFLKYRLEVVASWPESGRKRAAIEAILSRLNGCADTAVL